jgi:hypothetical protein
MTATTLPRLLSDPSRGLLNRRQCMQVVASCAMPALGVGRAVAASPNATMEDGNPGHPVWGEDTLGQTFAIRLEGPLLGQDAAQTLHIQANQPEAVWLAAAGGLHHAVYALTLSPMGDGPGMMLQWRPQTLEAGACGAATCNAFDIVLHEGVATEVPVAMTVGGERSTLTITAVVKHAQRMIIDARTMTQNA